MPSADALQGNTNVIRLVRADALLVGVDVAAADLQSGSIGGEGAGLLSMPGS